MSTPTNITGSLFKDSGGTKSYHERRNNNSVATLSKIVAPPFQRQVINNNGNNENSAYIFPISSVYFQKSTISRIGVETTTGGLEITGRRNANAGLPAI